MLTMVSPAFEYVFIGGLREDYCITHDGGVHLGILGGNAVYSAVGARIWSAAVGIVGRVGRNFPSGWLDELQHAGIDVTGVNVLPEPHSNITFYAYLTEEERVDTNPATHFLRAGHPLPKQLLDYQSSTEGQDMRQGFAPLAVRPADINFPKGQCGGSHLAPADYMTHVTVPQRLRDLGVDLITLDPSERYMEPGIDQDLSGILREVDAFLPSEAEARSVFKPDELNPREMLEAFGAMGCRYVVIKRGTKGQVVWDEATKHGFSIPAYPSRVRDVTGAGDAFCGGFLVGLRETGDVIEATLRGNISASMTIEGTGAIFALDALSGIAQARLDALRPSVKKL